MRRPRLTDKIAKGLGPLYSEASTTVDARHGWDDYYPDDPAQEAALEYIHKLAAWWEARPKKKPRSR